MEELWALRTAIEEQRYPDALFLLGELEEMSKDDKVEKIYSTIVILLLHLIKRAAEKRTTRSWDLSIEEALRRIKRTNKRRKAGGCYLVPEELAETIAEAYPEALSRAALEAFGGLYEAQHLATLIDEAAIQREALTLIQA